MNPPVPAGVDGKASDALLKLGKFFTRWEESDDGRVAFRKAVALVMSSTAIAGATTRWCGQPTG
jgi:hypothetical protein